MSNSAEVRDAQFIASDNRENFKQIIAKRSDLVKFKRGRLAPSLKGTTQQAGLVLGYATSGADSGFYKAYNDANTDGSQTAVGVLSESQVVESTPASGPGDGSEIAVIYEGDLFEDLLIGLDAAGKVDLGAHSYVEGGVNLIMIRS